MDRRSFLKVGATASGGLFLGISLLGCGNDDKAGGKAGEPAELPPPPDRDLGALAPPQPNDGADLNAWIRIEPDDRVTLFIPEAEMGQGILTAMAMILADELDADWDAVTVLHAPHNAEAFGRQSTGGSTSIRRGYGPVRQLAAAAREMLVAAAAADWKVPAAECKTADGAVIHGERRASYGSLATAAAALPAPEAPRLKPDSALRYIGKSTARVDIPAKVDGSAVFGIDVRVPGMVVASVEHSPIFGGTVGSVDDKAARAVPGVRDVVKIPTGVAVVADHYWAAKKGREALAVTWNDGGHGQLSSAAIIEKCKRALNGGAVARKDGDVTAALEREQKTLEAIYQVPYLAHAPMEPLGCTARVTADACELWVSTQSPAGSVKAAAEITGLKPTQIKVHSAMLGGGFGRRSQTDFVEDAVQLAKQLGVPVKVIWSREDDVRGGWYRPMAYNQLRGAVSSDGLPVVWSHQIASPSIIRPQWGLRDGIDGAAVEGAANLPYGIRHQLVTYADVELPISVWWWRSVGSSQNAFVTECFFDELCALTGIDPVEARLTLLAKHPRHKAVLQAAAAAAKWAEPAPAGRARGVAVHESFGSIVAQVAEVSIEDKPGGGKRPRVHAITCAVDCGQIVNPDTVVAQMESGIVYGLTAALYGEIAIDKGRAVASNFHDYQMLRIDEMPAVEVKLVPSGDAHGGVGEPGLPPTAPAVCNALRALTGKPIRKLPIALT